MDKEKFEKYRKLWKLEWWTHWRFLDVGFEEYMLMKGMTKEQFEKLNNESYEKEISKKQ